MKLHSLSYYASYFGGWRFLCAVLYTYMIALVSKDSTSLPVSLPDIKAHLRVDNILDDNYITALIKTARDFIEGETGIDLTDATYDGKLSGFPSGAIELTMLPVQSVDSVSYYDTDNTLQTWDSTNYHAMIPTDGNAWIEPTNTTTWPSTYARPDAVAIRYQVGRTTDEVAQHCIKMLVTSWYETRTDEEATGKTLPVGADRLLDQLRQAGYR